jgi:hypothetical protein
LELSHYDAAGHPGVLSRFQRGYLWDELQTHDPRLAKRNVAAKECLILRGEIDDGDNLNFLRDSVGLLTFLLDHGGVTVYDPFQFCWWKPEDWRKRIFAPAAPVPTHHVVVLTSPETAPGLTWFHTRGMRKFGRPDLSIHDVPARDHQAILDLCNRFIEFQALGGIIEESQEIRMPSLPERRTCHHRGDLDDPDFNNVHVEIVQERQKTRSP